MKLTVAVLEISPESDRFANAFAELQAADARRWALFDLLRTLFVGTLTPPAPRLPGPYSDHGYPLRLPTTAFARGDGFTLYGRDEQGEWVELGGEG